MKNLALIVFLLGSVSEAKNEIKEIPMEKYGLLKSGECYEVHKLEFTIIAKIDDHHYEMRGDAGVGVRSILETKKAVYEETGKPVGIGVKHVGQTKLKLENGFSSEYVLWQECFYDEKIEELTGVKNPLYSWPNPVVKNKTTRKRKKN